MEKENKELEPLNNPHEHSMTHHNCDACRWDQEWLNRNREAINELFSTTDEQSQKEGWEEVVNNFIKKWCGENAAHLLDSDENDGQRLRDLLSQERTKVREAALEAVEKELEEKKPYIDDYNLTMVKALLAKLKEEGK